METRVETATVGRMNGYNSSEHKASEYKLADFTPFQEALKELPVAMGLDGFDAAAFLGFACNPYDTQSAINMQKGMIASTRRQEMIDHVYQIVSKNEDFVQLFNERYLPRFPTNEELLQYPEGSYGRAVADHLISNGIQLDFAGIDLSVFYTQEMNLLGFMNMRGIRTHDLYHAALGLGTSPIDEYAVATFQLAQFGSPYHMLLVASGYIHTVFKAPSEILKFLETIHRFYRLGLEAKPFVGFRFEDHFATPVKEVRALLNLKI